MRRSFAPNNTIFMNSTMVGKIQKNTLEEIRVSVLKNNKIDFRTYFQFPNEAEPKPTKKGLWLSMKDVPFILSSLSNIESEKGKEMSAETPIANEEKLRVYSSLYKKNIICHIRVFYKKNGELLPKKGVSFSPEILSQVKKAIEDAHKLNGK
ncbi:MAG: transcriptional coactivator p15/PC4 family protein [Endomicrobiales bacterium]|nr:transcriptional coactivator p15/PC4 family protein [Endomicrobiales bacterium]